MIWGREESSGGKLGFIPISDGMWVAEMTEYTLKYRDGVDVFVVGLKLFKKGVTRYLLRDYLLRGSDVAQDYAVVSDQPFGVVELLQCMEAGNFSPARQIHKGELGRGPGVPRKPRFVQTTLLTGKPKAARCRMTELAEIVGMPCQEVVKFYSKFGRLEPIAASFPIGPGVECRVADKETDLVDPTARSTLGACRGEFDRIWVPASWAMTVLYCHQFGYKP